MKIKADERLFWFLKDGIELDLDEPSHLDMFVHQVMTRGRASDVKTMLKLIGIQKLTEAFQRLQKFLPMAVQLFWSDYLASH